MWESVGTLWASKFNSKSRNLWRAADMGRFVLLISTGFLCVQLEMQCYRFPNCSMFIQPKHVLSAASHLQMQSIHLHKIRHVFRFIETFFSCWYVYLWCNVQTHKKKQIHKWKQYNREWFTLTRFQWAHFHCVHSPIPMIWICKRGCKKHWNGFLLLSSLSLHARVTRLCNVVTIINPAYVHSAHATE